MTNVGFCGVVGATNVLLFIGSSTVGTLAGSEVMDGSQSIQTSCFG
jgi:hypothetical protein